MQLYNGTWDSHDYIERAHGNLVRGVDQPIAALIADLKQRGLLDSTLIVWCGEFGRTPQGEPRDLIGRDHHVEAFTMWLAGGGIKTGQTIGATDEIGYYITEDKIHVHDLHATLLHLLGIDHLKLTYKFQGRHFRLTDVHGAVVKEILN